MICGIEVRGRFFVDCAEDFTAVALPRQRIAQSQRDESGTPVKNSSPTEFDIREADQWRMLEPLLSEFCAAGDINYASD